MKKLLYFMAAMTLMFFTACDDMDHAIADQTDRIDQLEKLSIKEIEDQITAINASIEDLEAVDKELDGYIQTLEVTAGNLQKELEDVNTEIDNLKSELEGEISTAKQELLDKLTDLQKDIENELAGIRKDIEELEAKDKELEGKIEDLQTYVDEKLGDTEDWAKTTFATLEQYEALQEEVAEISESIAAINKSITDLETRVNDKIAADIKTATDALRTELGKDYTDKIDAAVKKVTEGYTTAVSAAKEEITAAYTKAIADAITASEKGMKEWVNKTLAEGYYDIAAIDAKLKELETSLTGADTELAEQIEAQKEALEQAKEDLKKAYEKAIADAIETNNGVITEAYEEAIDEAVEGLNATISGINTAIDDIKVKLGIIDKEITALKTRIQSIRFIPEYSDGMVEFDGTFTLKFILAPKAAAGEVTLAHVTSFISHAKERTRAAGDPEALTVASVTGDDQTGILEVAVSAASLTADFWADGYNANTYICISDGNNDVISEMIPTFTRPYVTFNAGSEQTLKVNDGVAVRSSDVSGGFEYSVRWGAWTPLTTDPVTFGHDHGALRLRGKSETGTDGKNIVFGNNTPVACSGDIRTLVDWEDHDDADTESAVFANLFNGCTQLTSAPELPSTELAEGCYQNMFAGCTSLEEAPELPAETLTANCYNGMFAGCTSLGSVTIKATDTSAEGCMTGMLENVTLTEPSEIVVASLTDLTEKIADVPAGSTICLGVNIEASDIIVINKDITLDGKGYTLTSTAGRAINVSGVGNATIKNLKINCTGERGINVIQNSKNVNIENVTATVYNYAVNVAGSAAEANITITGSDLTGLNVVNIGAKSVIVTITDTKLTCNDQNDQESYAAIALNADAIESKVTVSGGEIIVSGDSPAGKEGADGSTITIGNDVAGNNTIEKRSFAIRYGDYHYGFGELTSALAKVLDGETIILTRDVELSQTYNITKDITIDLNGYKLTNNVKGGRVFDITANDVIFTLDATDSEVEFGNGTYGMIQLVAGTNNAKITITGGTFTGTTDAGALIRYRSGDNNAVTLKNVNYTDNCEVKGANVPNAFVISSNGASGTGNSITVNGGSFKACGMIADAILDAEFTDVNVYATGAGFELNKGTISNSTITLDPGSYVYSADGGAVSVSHNGYINISNSKVVTQSYGYVVYPTGGTINITDCTIEGKEENKDKWYYIYDQYSGKTGTIIIDNVTKVTKSNP